jgi:hypothetical protein
LACATVVASPGGVEFRNYAEFQEGKKGNSPE